MQNLAGESYLFQNGTTLKSIMKAATKTSENFQKRRINLTDNRSESLSVYIPYLCENPPKNLWTNTLVLQRLDQGAR